MALKINLGSGYKSYPGFLNIDDDKLVKPDFLVCLDDKNLILPLEDNSVDEVIAHHILEHIGSGFIRLMQEIYRVCQHGAIIDIRVPHHFHEVFINDMTHCRPITVEGMRLLSKSYNKEHIKSMGSSSGLGLKFNVDFEIVDYDYVYDSFYHEMINDYRKRQSEGNTTQMEDFAFIRLFREANNVAIETLIKLVVIKE